MSAAHDSLSALIAPLDSPFMRIAEPMHINGVIFVALINQP